MRSTLIVFAICSCIASVPAWGQDQQDPASDSDVIEKTLNKINEVGKLDTYISENTALKALTKQLQTQIAALNKQVQELTQKLATENERMRKQLLQLPPIEVKSKLIGASKSMAVLVIGDKTVRIRDNASMSVPLVDDVWTLMKVKKITIELIELEFPELERELTLFD